MQLIEALTAGMFTDHAAPTRVSAVGRARQAEAIIAAVNELIGRQR
jgi:hypothetical protein